MIRTILLHSRERKKSKSFITNDHHPLLNILTVYRMVLNSQLFDLLSLPLIDSDKVNNIYKYSYINQQMVPNLGLVSSAANIIK